MARKTLELAAEPELGPLTDDRLTRDVSVYQRAKGHRFSSDDVITAWVAAEEVPAAKRVLDLGCGLGSVLLHLAWSLPTAVLVGLEAQSVSFRLLTLNVARSGFAERIRIEHGDLREPAVIARLGSNFDLITCTPPYFPPGAALDAEDEQRAYARLEYRGGVEAYLATATRLLAADGRIVLCGDARAEGRVAQAAAETGTWLRGRCDVVARAGRAPLFAVWTVGFAAGDCPVKSLVLRDEQGEPTQDAQRIRAFSGF